MEKIVDYKFKDFIKLEDSELIEKYLLILEFIKPINEVENPNYYSWDNDKPKIIKIKPLLELSFGQVTEIRNNFNNATIDSIIESISIVTGLQNKEIFKFTITRIYGIINSIKEQLEIISSMEINELSDEEDDIDLITVNANERMAKFGVLNTIDSLANGDLLKWDEIEKLPYLTVFTKLKMDKEKNKIQKEVSELQKKRLKN